MPVYNIAVNLKFFHLKKPPFIIEMAENGILDYQGMNQAIYRGATSNIVVDTQSMSIEIGAGNTSHTSNLHFECNHDANVASIKLNSNVVTEFPRSKKLMKFPRVAMTGQTTSNYTVTGSSWYGSSALGGSGTEYFPWKAFDNVGNSPTGALAWYSFDYSGTEAYSGTDYAFNPNHGGTATPVLFTGAVQGEWLKIQLPHKVALDHYIMYGPNQESEFPRDWTVYGSVDGTNWVRVDSRVSQIFGAGTGSGGTATGKKKEYQLDTPTNEYLYFGFVITRGSVNRTVYVGVGEIELYGVPEYDPEADGTDVTLKSLANVPNTDWLEVYYDAKDLENGAITTVDDLTPNGTNDGTAHNGVTVSDGAFVFDGTNDYISTSITTPMTYHTASMWIQFDSPSQWECVYSIAPSTLSGFDNFNLYVNTNYFRLETGSSGSNFPYYDFHYDFEIGKWVHLTFIFRGSGLEDCEMYINNKRLSRGNGSQNSTADITLSGTNILRVGTAYSTSYFHDGKIANFRLFNRILTTDEIYQLYAYQKEYFGHGDLNMTLKAGRLGIGTSEPRAALDVRGDVHISGSLRKTRARMIHPNPTGISFGQDGWQTFVSYGEEWTAYSNNPLYSVSITGDFVDGTSRGIHYRLAVQNQRTMEVLYFPSSSGWIKYHYTNHTRLDGHGFLGIMSNLTLGDSYKVQLEVDPNSASNYQWEPTYGTITGLVWD